MQSACDNKYVDKLAFKCENKIYGKRKTKQYSPGRWPLWNPEFSMCRFLRSKRASCEEGDMVMKSDARLGGRPGLELDVSTKQYTINAPSGLVERNPCGGANQEAAQRGGKSRIM